MASFKYKAFISYSHADERHGEWLQRALERFRAPSSLVGTATSVGEVPGRLTPVFRDRADLPAAGNLNAEIQAALAASQFQIVLCSPNAATSRWVNEEVKLFKKLHGQERTLAVIVAGEPGASAIPGREAEECFPPALRFRIDAGGALTDEPAEPIAADARKEGDGRRYAILKLAAGLLGVGLDDLVRRDVQRRTRNAWTVAGASTALAASMTGLALYANHQGAEAKRMRGEAEGLITFMLGELRDKVEPLGRTDVLQAVGEKALAYYENEKGAALDDEALSKRASALALIAEMDMRRGALDSALTAFEESARASGLLLTRNPKDQKLIFDHAQSVFYIGEIAMKREDRAGAEERMLDYLRLAERLVALDGANPDWRLELAYATSNIGALKFRAGEFAESLPYYERSAEARLELFEAAPADQRKALAYAYALSWIAFAALKLGDFERAAAEIEKQLSVYKPILATDPENFNILDPLVTAQRRLSDARLCLGDVPGAVEALSAARATAEKLMARDPSNANWIMNAAHVEIAGAALASIRGDMASEVEGARRSIALLDQVLAKEKTHREANVALISALAPIAATGDTAETRDAVRRLSEAQAAAFNLSPEVGLAAVGEGGVVLAAYQDRRGDPAAARAIRDKAIASLEGARTALPTQAKLRLAQLYLDAGDTERSRAVAGELTAKGFRHPAFVALLKRLDQGPQR